MTRRTDLDLDMEERRHLLDAWVEKRRQIATLEAEATELLVDRIALHDADVSESPFHRDAIFRSMTSEYAAAGHQSKGTVEYAFTDARTLALSLPAVRQAFADGAISLAHVREIVRASAIVGEAVRNGTADAVAMELFEAAVLVVAENDTAARTRAHARQVAAKLAGITLTERQRKATDERCVHVKSLDDGLALLTAVVPEWMARAIEDRLTKMAQQIVKTRDEREPRASDAADSDVCAYADADADADADAAAAAAATIFGDETFTTDAPAADPIPMGHPFRPDSERCPADSRTVAQIRTDILTDLLLAGRPSAAAGTGLENITGRIQVTVAASTLAGADDRHAELDGFGPLPADVARCLAGYTTGWTRLFLDPSGLVRETDTYTPTEPMRRFLRARDQHCRFPGCRMPVHRCQIDHNHDHARGGRTALDNLSHFCVGHHSLKHPDIDERYRWTAGQLPDGSITWTSPLGRDYTDPPRRRVMFA